VFALAPAARADQYVDCHAGVVASASTNRHARAFFVDSITTVQDGTRVRLDVNWRLARKL
jgi:hypothetical protein